MCVSGLKGYIASVVNLCEKTAAQGRVLSDAVLLRAVVFYYLLDIFYQYIGEMIFMINALKMKEI